MAYYRVAVNAMKVFLVHAAPIAWSGSYKAPTLHKLSAHTCTNTVSIVQVSPTCSGTRDSERSINWTADFPDPIPTIQCECKYFPVKRELFYVANSLLGWIKKLLKPGHYPEFKTQHHKKRKQAVLFELNWIIAT